MLTVFSAGSLPPPPLDFKLPKSDLDAPLGPPDQWQEDADLLATGAWDDEADDATPAARKGDPPAPDADGNAPADEA